MGTFINVGEEYTLFNGDKLKGIDAGMIFESLPQSGYFMNIYLRDVTEEEIDIITTYPMKVRVLQDTSSLVLPTVRFGSTPLLFDISFDPTLYRDNSSLQLTFDNNMVHVVVIDSRTNIVRGLRLVSLPIKLREIWVRAWALALQEEGFSEKYNSWIGDIYSRYPLEKLWDISKYIGKFGDTSN